MPPHDTASSLACAAYKQTNTLVFLPVLRCYSFVVWRDGGGAGGKDSEFRTILGKTIGWNTTPECRHIKEEI